MPLNVTGDRLYDLLMRAPIVGLTVFFLVREFDGLRSSVGLHPYLDYDAPFLLNVAARVAVIQFLVLLGFFFLTRRRPIRKLASWSAKISALLGYGLGLLVFFLPRAASDVWLDGLSTLLILGGNTVCILALLSLGRSLSIMPEARKLVTDGLYQRIRHPLYLAEEIAVLGLFLQYRSWQAAAILTVHFIFQLQRIKWEERVLAEAFPEYLTYCRRSHRLIPGLY